MRYFDSHCHLQMPQFDSDRELVLANMRKNETGGIVVGVDFETSRAGLELAKQHEFLWASVGLHPNPVRSDASNGANDIEQLGFLATHPKVVAIGECGLDYFRSGGSEEGKSAQKKKFEQQIKLALKIQKPLIIHCRDSQQRIANTKSAHENMLEMLSSYSEALKERSVIAVIHFFTGSAELAQKYLNLGCYISFPGPITYGEMYDESVRVTPLEKMLAETDAPFAAPVPHRGKRNEPAFVVEVVRKLAALKEISPEQMSEQIVFNSRKVFGLQ